MVVALLLGYGLYALVVVNAFCGIIVICLKLNFLRRKDPQSIAWKFFDKKLTKDIFLFSMWVMVVSIAQRLILNITPSILGMTSGSREIAIFSAGKAIEGYIWTFSTVFGGMFIPRISKLVYSDNANPGAIQELMIKVGRIQFLLLAGIVSIFIVAGKDFFLNWLGYDFEKSYLITVLLISSSLITTPQQIASSTLIVTNQVKYNALSKSIIALISVILSYIMSLKYGSTGSGIAIFIGNLIGGALVMNIIYAKVLKIDVWDFFKKCQLSMSIPFFLVLMIGIFLNHFFIEISWLTLLIKVSVLLFIYIFSSYLFSMNKYEKGLIINGLTKGSKK